MMTWQKSWAAINSQHRTTWFSSNVLNVFGSSLAWNNAYTDSDFRSISQYLQEHVGIVPRLDVMKIGLYFFYRTAFIVDYKC
jgi:hypothetical protein